MLNRSFTSVVCAAALALSLGGCDLQAEIGKIDGSAHAALLAANVVIAKNEPTVAAFLNNHLAQADGYFQQIAKTGALSQAQIAGEAAVMAKANKLTASLPTTVAGVAQELATIFTAVQEFSTVAPS